MINFKITDAITFKDLANQAQTEEQINFVRKVILNADGDPNRYFTEQRTVLEGDNIVQKMSLDNGDSKR